MCNGREEGKPQKRRRRCGCGAFRQEGSLAEKTAGGVAGTHIGRMRVELNIQRS